MSDEITMEEVKKIVSFIKDDFGRWIVHDIECDVAGSIDGSVSGKIYGDVEEIKGSILGGVGNGVFGTIGGNVHGNILGGVTGFIGGEVKGSVGDYTEDGMRRRGFVQAGIPIVSTLVDGLRPAPYSDLYWRTGKPVAEYTKEVRDE